MGSESVVVLYKVPDIAKYHTQILQKAQYGTAVQSRR